MGCVRAHPEPLDGLVRAAPLVASVFAAIGGPLAYLGAARGFDAVAFPAPAWPALAWLAACWAVALPLLLRIASHHRPARTTSMEARA